MDEVNRFDGLLLVNEYGNLYFLLHNFEGQIIPFKLEKLKKLLEEKRYNYKCESDRQEARENSNSKRLDIVPSPFLQLEEERA